MIQALAGLRRCNARVSKRKKLIDYIPELVKMKSLAVGSSSSYDPPGMWLYQRFVATVKKDHCALLVCYSAGYKNCTGIDLLICIVIVL